MVRECLCDHSTCHHAIRVWLVCSISQPYRSKFTCFLSMCLIDDRAHKGWSHTSSKWCVSVYRTIAHVITPSVLGWFAHSPSPIILNSHAFLSTCLIDDRAHKGWSHTFFKWCVSVHRTIVHVTTPSVLGWFAHSPSPVVLNSHAFLSKCLIDDRAHKGWS